MWIFFLVVDVCENFREATSEKLYYVEVGEFIFLGVNLFRIFRSASREKCFQKNRLIGNKWDHKSAAQSDLITFASRAFHVDQTGKSEIHFVREIFNCFVVVSLGTLAFQFSFYSEFKPSNNIMKWYFWKNFHLPSSKRWKIMKVFPAFSSLVLCLTTSIKVR